MRPHNLRICNVNKTKILIYICLYRQIIQNMDIDDKEKEPEVALEAL